jgi:outer membrane lipoprotein-sorting protein
VNEDKDIQIALMPAPMDREAPEPLKRKLRLMAGEKSRRRMNWWSLSPVALVGVTALGMVAFTMLPAKAAAKTFDLVVAAAQQVNAFQFSVVSNEKAKREFITIAGSDGHVYMRSEQGTFFQLDPGSMTIFDPDEKSVMRFKFGNLVDAKEVMNMVQSGIAEGMKEMDLKKMLKEYEAKYGRDNIRISPVSQGVYHVTLASNQEPERVEMTIDAATNLPERLVVDSRDGGTWHNEVTMEMRFGARVDPSLLRSTIPANVKVQEIDLGSMVGDAMKGMENFGKQIPKP